MSPNKQLQRTVRRRHVRATSASRHYALAARITPHRAAAGLGVRRHVVPRDTLQEIATLLEEHNASSNDLAIALLGDNDKMWRYLVSNELWGGAGSVADQALLDSPDARRQLERLLIRLGREQMDLGRVNVRTEMWVTAFEKWRAEGIR